MLCYSCCFWGHLFLQLARFFSFDGVSLVMLMLPGVLSHPDGSVAGTSMARIQLVPSGMLSSNALYFSVVDMDHGLPVGRIGITTLVDLTVRGMFLILGIFNKPVQMEPKKLLFFLS